MFMAINNFRSYVFYIFHIFFYQYLIGPFPKRNMQFKPNTCFCITNYEFDKMIHVFSTVFLYDENIEMKIFLHVTCQQI